MPVIQFYGPSMSKEQKENLVKEFANAASNITSLPVDKFVTLIHEMEGDNVGSGAHLLSNR